MHPLACPFFFVVDPGAIGHLGTKQLCPKGYHGEADPSVED